MSNVESKAAEQRRRAKQEAKRLKRETRRLAKRGELVATVPRRVFEALLNMRRAFAFLA